MKLLSRMLVVGCLAVTAWALAPLASRPVPRALDAVGVGPVRHPDFARIDLELQRRAPGMGLALRERVAAAVAEEAQANGFDPLLILALIAVESEFQESAVSVVGAKGLMQIRPSTLYFVAEKQGIRLSREEIDADPALAVRMGVRYLRQMADLFGGDLNLALMAYNAGPNKLADCLKHHDKELFWNYVRAVRRNYLVLRQLHGQTGDWALASRKEPGR
jgi:soluble lytic murein transglycosylase